MEARSTPGGPPAAAAQKPAKAETTYVILEQLSESGSYSRVGTFTAASSDAAKRKAGEATEGGTYIAVPERSFVPTKVTVETKKTVTLGGA